MLAFAIGTVLPLVLIGMLSREALMRWRGNLVATGATAKSNLGLTLIALSVTPKWLTDLSGRF